MVSGGVESASASCEGGARTARPAPRGPRRRCRAGRSQTGASSPCARNIPTAGRPPPAARRRRRAAGPARRARGPRRSGSTQRRCSGCPTSVQYAASTEVSRAVGPRPRWPAPGRPPCVPSASSTSATQKSKPSCTVTSSGSSSTRSCSRGPAPGASVRPTMLPGSASSAGQHGGRGRGSGRRSCAGPAARARSRRRRGPSPAPPSAAASRAGPCGRPSARVSGAVAAGTSSRIATMSRSPAGPRTAGRRSSAAPGRSCRGRPCSDGPSRTGTAGADRPLRLVPRVRRRRCGCAGETSFPCREH